MLRWVVLLLLVANAAFYAWSLGWLDDIVGVRARGDREPERLARQVNPESIVILSGPGPAASTAPAQASPTPAAGPSCLEAGPFGPAELVAAEAALRSAMPAANWTDIRSEKPATWLVYMGSYPDRDALRRKEEEIKRVRAEIEEVSLPSEGEFGISLGRFDDRAAAERSLAQHQQRGIRTARVVQGSLPTTAHQLRIERADPALVAQLASLKAEALGAGFLPCGTQDGAPR